MRFAWGKVYRSRSSLSCRLWTRLARLQHFESYNLSASAVYPAHLMNPGLPHSFEYRKPFRHRNAKIDYRRMPVFDGFAQATADCLINLDEDADYSSSPDIMAYLAIVGRRHADICAPTTAQEIEDGKAYLASELQRGVGHFIDPTRVPACTDALPLAGLTISPSFTQSARPGHDAGVAVWARLLQRPELAAMVSHSYEESLYITEDHYLQFPLRRNLITTNIRAPLPYGILYSKLGHSASSYLKIALDAYRLDIHPVSNAFLNPWLSYYATDGKNTLRELHSTSPPSSWMYWTKDACGFPLDHSPTPIIPSWKEAEGLEGIPGWVKYVTV